MTIDQQPSLRLVDRMPLGTDICATSAANLALWLHDLRYFFPRRAIDLDRGCCSRYSRRGCPAIGGRRDCGSAGRPCSGRNQVGFSSTTSQGQIGLLEISNIELQRVDATLIHHILDPMDTCLRDVIFAPDSSRHRSAFATDADYAMLISPRALDRRDIKPKSIAMLVGTFDMYLDAAVGIVASHARTTLLAAGFANFLVRGPGDGGDAFAWLECLRISESDLRMEDGAGDMNPIVVCRPLERLSWIYRPPKVLLALAVKVGCLYSHLFFQSLALPFLFGLLLVRDLGRLHKVMLGGLNCA